MRCLVAVAVVLSLLSEHICAQAPGDVQTFCMVDLPNVGVNILDYPPEVKPLMDSRHYQQLLPPNTGAVWQTVDNDNNNNLSSIVSSWRQAGSSSCRVTLAVCGFSAGSQDNWIITQHISRMVNGTALQQVTVQVDFIMNTCNIQNNCRRSFAIHKYETSTINTTAARNLSNYQFVGRIVPRDGSGTVRENGSVNINFATEATGFYLGIQDETSCVLIHRVLVFYYVCPAVTSDLITHPETIAPVIGASQVVGQCVENASPVSGTGPRFVCSQNGIWSSNIGTECVCGSGFQSSSDSRSCVGCDPGMYLAMDETCLPCPAKSNSTQSGASVCACFEEYYRAARDPPAMRCTQPPSAPRNLQVLQVSNTTTRLSWDPPVSNGGRDDLEYQLSYQIATSSEPVTIYGRVNMTEGQITGLRPFTQYVVFVSSENGVSAQDTDDSGRTVSANTTTLEGVPSAISPAVIQVNEDSDIVTWQPPAEPNGVIQYYNIRISHDNGTGGEELVRVVPGLMETRYDLSTLGLHAETYVIQIQAVTSAGVGEYSQRITITINGCDPGTYQATTDTCLPCPANSNSTKHGLFVCPCFEGYYRTIGDQPEMGCTRAESPATLVVAATISSIVAVITIIMVVILLCAYIQLRMKLDKISKMAANDHPEYATVGPHPTSIRTEENVAYETGIQPMDTKPNIAYGTGMQGHSLHAQEHNSSV